MATVSECFYPLRWAIAVYWRFRRSVAILSHSKTKIYVDWRRIYFDNHLFFPLLLIFSPVNEKLRPLRTKAIISNWFWSWRRGVKKGLEETLGPSTHNWQSTTRNASTNSPRRSLCCREKSRSEPSNALGVFEAPTTSGCFLRWQNHCWTKQFPSPFGRPTTFCSGTGITISFSFVFVIWSLPPWWRMMIMSCLFSFSRSLDTSPTMLSSSPSFTQPHEQTQLHGPGNFNFANFFFFFWFAVVVVGVGFKEVLYFYSSGDA